MHRRRVGVRLRVFFQAGSGHRAGLGQIIPLFQTPVVELDQQRTAVLAKDSEAAAGSSLNLAVKPVQLPVVGHPVRLPDPGWKRHQRSEVPHAKPPKRWLRHISSQALDFVLD